MAKRSIRSQADDSATSNPAEPRARRARVPPADVDMQQARTATGDRRAVELDPEPRARLAGNAIQSAAAAWPSEDEIRLRAYHRYLERGGGHGRAFDDWVEAERELKLRG